MSLRRGFKAEANRISLSLRRDLGLPRMLRLTCSHSLSAFALKSFRSALSLMNAHRRSIILPLSRRVRFRR
jgi:hypothetical protein